MAVSKQPKHAKTATIGNRTFKLKFGKVPLTVPFSPDELNKGEALRKRKGLSTVQDVVRVAYAELLERNGLNS